MSKVLDHSSFDTLLADLDCRSGGMFYFRTGGGDVSAPWKLEMATTINVGTGVVRSVRLKLRTEWQEGDIFNSVAATWRSFCPVPALPPSQCRSRSARSDSGGGKRAAAERRLFSRPRRLPAPSA